MAFLPGDELNPASMTLEQALLMPDVIESCIPRSVLLAIANGNDLGPLRNQPNLDFGANFLVVEGLMEPCTDALLRAINTAAAVEAGPVAVRMSGTAMNVTGLSKQQILMLQ